jgi:hypothetical protein
VAYWSLVLSGFSQKSNPGEWVLTQLGMDALHRWRFAMDTELGRLGRRTLLWMQDSASAAMQLVEREGVQTHNLTSVHGVTAGPTVRRW